ncbi:MAG: 6,7-dimethyl-8-ribityllumazine synthase [Gammaproteobacteria bacterium]|nr:6,7-dimethyl-8-ribityllumazine synthase [Gammaproteobacteria bacterium]
MNIIKAETINQAKIAIVVSEFNQEITGALLDGAVKKLQEMGINDFSVIKVPGAVEIPFIAQALAKTARYDAIIALGAVVRGETSHYDYVCDQVSQGCQRVMLDHGIPVIFGVLTTENEQQAWDRLGGKHGHKGREASEVALAMISLVRQLS